MFLVGAVVRNVLGRFWREGWSYGFVFGVWYFFLDFRGFVCGWGVLGIIGGYWYIELRLRKLGISVFLGLS